MILNLVVLIGVVITDPVERRLPDGQQVVELRVSVPEPGRKTTLPLPVVVKGLDGLPHGLPIKGDEVIVTGSLFRRFYRSGAGARSLTEVIASEVRIPLNEEAE